jgi:hypothetical protein
MVERDTAEYSSSQGGYANGGRIGAMYGGRIGYQIGGDVAYDATDSIYGSSAITVTPDTILGPRGNQIQAQTGVNPLLQRIQNAQNAPSASETLGNLYNKQGIMNAQSNFLRKAVQSDPQAYETTGSGFTSDLRHKTAAAQLRDRLGGGIMGNIAANVGGALREIPQLLTGDFKGVGEDLKANYGGKDIPVGLTPQESYDYLIAQQQVDPGVAVDPTPTPDASTDRPTIADVAGPIQDSKRKNLYLKDIGIDGINDESPLNSLQKYLDLNKNIKNNTVLNEYVEGARSGYLSDYVDPYAEGFNLEKDYFNSPNNLRRLAIDYDPRSGKLAYYDKNQGPYGAYKYYSGDLVDQDFVDSFGLKRFDPKDLSTFTTPQAYGLASGREIVIDLMDNEGFEFGEAVKEAYRRVESTENKANGGRIGYSDGTDFEKYLKGREEFNKKQNAEQIYKEYLENKRRQEVAEQKTMAANGGRIGYAMGSDDLVDQASGIMGLPKRTNNAGVKELDLRDSGGFIPPNVIK